MKRIFIGFVIGVVVTLGVQRAWSFWQFKHYTSNPNFMIPDVAKELTTRELPGSTFVEASWSTSTNHVNFAHDALYDVTVIYKRQDQTREITIPIGRSRGIWITPPALVMESLDQKAKHLNPEMK